MDENGNAQDVIDGVVGDHYGMITRAQAEGIADFPANPGIGRPGKADVSAILEFAKVHSGGNEPQYAVDLEDRIYRIFNVRASQSGESRTVVLGSEGTTITMLMFGRIAGFIDANRFERGDLVFVKNALLDAKSGSLRCSRGTTISRIAPSHWSAADLSSLAEGQRNIDISAKVVEIGPIRHVGTLSGNGNVAVSDCVISNGIVSLPVSMWGSSALATASMGLNSTVRIEFCSVRRRNGTLEVYANDNSRVLAMK